MKALLGPFQGCCRVEGKEKFAGLREDPEVVENDDNVISLGIVGESGSGGGRCRKRGASSESGCDGTGEIGCSWDSEGSGWGGGGGEGSRDVVGSSGSGVEDSCCEIEGCRVEETGLARGGVGKREYLDFFLSIQPKAGEKKVRVQQGQSMEGRERVERVGGKWKSDSVGNEEIDDARRKDVANRSHMWSGW